MKESINSDFSNVTQLSLTFKGPTTKAAFTVNEMK
jgi:hypothetical protein